MPEAHKLTFSRLQAGGTYHLSGDNIAIELSASAEGTAEIEVAIAGRIKLLLEPT